jgi:hypothetical protein
MLKLDFFVTRMMPSNLSMQQIGDLLPFPDNCGLPVDKIYPNQLVVRIVYISRYSIQLEHAVAEMKTY